MDIQDEHVEGLDLNDTPDLVVIQVYITSAHRAYRLADHYRRRGAYVTLGGLHVTSRPDEAAAHADTIFVGPGEDTWPRFLADLRRGCPERIYRSRVRTLVGLPPGFRLALVSETPELIAVYDAAMIEALRCGIDAKRFASEPEAAAWLVA